MRTAISLTANTSPVKMKCMRPLQGIFAAAIAVFILAALAAQAGQRPVLYIYTWSDYFEPKVLHNFERKHKCRVVLESFDSGDDMYAKLREESCGYDVVVSPSYMSAIMRRQNMLRNLDRSAIPNLKHVDSAIAHLTEDPDMAYGIPYTRVVSGVGYNRTRVAEYDLGSWGIFGNKAYAKHMTLANDVRETMAVALKYLGYSLNTTNAEELEEAGELLALWKPNLAMFEIDKAKIGLANGEIAVVHSYNGDVAFTMRENPDIDFFFPREGTSLTVDQIAILAGAEMPDLAHAFINYMLDPYTSARNMQGIRYYMPNPDAIELLPDDLRNAHTFSVPKKILERCEVIRDLGADNSKYAAVWEKLRRR